ncbi:hypothetical protein WA016_05666 [Myxococcus stipitatus]
MECSAREQKLPRLADKSRKLFVFLREHRHELFDGAFQAELESMYRERLIAHEMERRLLERTVEVAKQPKSCVAAPLTRSIEALAQVREQDLEPHPKGGVQIRQGVAADRRISIEDPDRRHGSKSKRKRCNGDKQHLSTDLVVVCALTTANRPDEEATGAPQEDMAHQDLFPDVLLIDRAY